MVLDLMSTGPDPVTRCLLPDTLSIPLWIDKSPESDLRSKLRLSGAFNSSILISPELELNCADDVSSVPLPYILPEMVRTEIIPLDCVSSTSPEEEVETRLPRCPVINWLPEMVLMAEFPVRLVT